MGFNEIDTYTNLERPKGTSLQYKYKKTNFRLCHQIRHISKTERLKTIQWVAYPLKYKINYPHVYKAFLNACPLQMSRLIRVCN